MPDPARKSRNRRKGSGNPLIRRKVTDANFIHVLRMYPVLRLWCGGVPEGHKLDFNDLNIVRIPVEIAEALIRERAERDDEIGGVCREIVAALDIGGVAGAAAFLGATDDA